LGRSEAVTLPLAGQKKHTQNRIFVENKKVKKQQARYINGIGYMKGLSSSPKYVPVV
jgi:ribosomal protein S16